MVKSMELRKPTMNDEIRIKKYIEEHYDNGEYEIYASNGLTSMNYEDWLEYLAYCEKGLDKEFSKEMEELFYKYILKTGAVVDFQQAFLKNEIRQNKE